MANNAIAGLLHICRDFRRHLRYEVCKVDKSVIAFGEKIIALIEFSEECLSYSLQYYHKNVSLLFVSNTLAEDTALRK